MIPVEKQKMGNLTKRHLVLRTQIVATCQNINKHTNRQMERIGTNLLINNEFLFKKKTEEKKEIILKYGCFGQEK